MPLCDCSMAYRQCAAVRIYLLPITLPPHRGDHPYPTLSNTRHCHGHECWRASSPPTIRVNQTRGSMAGLPHVRFPASAIRHDYKSLTCDNIDCSNTMPEFSKYYQCKKCIGDKWHSLFGRPTTWDDVGDCPRSRKVLELCHADLRLMEKLDLRVPPPMFSRTL